MRRVRVIGGGSWGSALAAALNDDGNDVAVLVRDEATVMWLAEGRCRQLADIPPVVPIAASTDPAILDGRPRPAGSSSWRHRRDDRDDPPTYQNRGAAGSLRKGHGDDSGRGTADARAG